MSTISSIFLILLLATVFIFLVLWIVISEENFTDQVLPTPGAYTVGNRSYQNNLPLHPMSSTPYLLKHGFIERIRLLYSKTHAVLSRAEIPFWVSGGTLLGVARNGCLPLPFDDDVDLHVPYSHKDFLFSLEFSQRCQKAGLKTLFLKFNNSKTADKHGASCRLKLDDDLAQPVLDIFFVVDVEGRCKKVESWNFDQYITNPKEDWAHDDIFPIQRRKIDGLEVRMPNRHRAVLTKQYGSEVWESVYARPKLFSHAFPFFFQRLWN